jgi:hypothetical protein
MFPSSLKNLFSKKSRPARRGRRPARVLFELERLEAREVPAVFAFPASGQLVVGTTTPGTDTVSIDHLVLNNQPFTVVNESVVFLDSNITQGIHIQGGFATVDILATAKPLTVEGDATFVNVGKAGNLQGILAPVSLTNDKFVTLDDSNDSVGQNVTVNVANEVVQVTGMGGAPISATVFGADIFGNNDLKDLKMFGGHGHNTFNILDTPNAFRFFNQETTTEIFTGTGGDTVNLRGTSSRTLAIQGQARDTVSIGNNHNLNAIQSPVTITNLQGSTALIVDGSGAASAQNVSLSVDFTNGVGFIDGLAPKDIAYRVSDISVLDLFGGPHGNTWTVHDTFANPRFASHTTIFTGDGDNNSVTVLATTGSLTINGGGGHDQVNVGGDTFSNGTLSRIHGEVDVDNFGGQRTQLLVNERGDLFNHVFLLDGGAFQGAIRDIRGSITTAPITYTSQGVHSVDVLGGPLFDQFFVASVPLGTGINLNGLQGNDEFRIGSQSNTLDTILGPVNVIGGSGLGGSGASNSLFVHDEGVPVFSHGYQLLTNEIVRTGGGTPPVTIFFSNIPPEAVHLFEGGDAGGPAAQDLALPRHVRVGAPATLTGQLVDADPSQVLTLTVSWGDGSRPQTSTPDRDPFAVTHTYASPGVYTVHVIWSDSHGVSNSRGLTIRVLPARHGEQDGDPEPGDHDADVVNRLDAFFRQDSDGADGLEGGARRDLFFASLGEALGGHKKGEVMAGLGGDR